MDNSNEIEKEIVEDVKMKKRKTRRRRKKKVFVEDTVVETPVVDPVKSVLKTEKKERVKKPRKQSAYNLYIKNHSKDPEVVKLPVKQRFKYLAEKYREEKAKK